MPKKIILVKKWGMYPVGHVFENPSLVTIKALCYDQTIGRLVGDDYLIDHWRRQDRATKQLLAEAKGQAEPTPGETPITQEEKDVWKEQLEKEKQTVTFDDIVEEAIPETLPIAAQKVTKKKAVTKLKKKKRAAPKRRKKVQRKK